MRLIRTELNPFDITFDKENPRDQTQSQIENDPQFKKLKEDIEEIGLFYPVAIKKEKVNGKEYVLVDGERRLRASQSLKLEKIPVILVEGDFDKRVLAYKLHMLSKPWSKKVQVKSVNQIISELKEDGMSEDEILKIVEDLTKMPRDQIRAILKILRYPKEAVELMEEQKSYRTYLTESENNFIPFIKESFPKLFDKYDEKKLRKIIGKKLVDKKLGRTTWIFRNLKDYIKDECKNKGQAEERLGIFLENPDVDVKYIFEGVKSDNEGKEKEILNLFQSKNKKKKVCLDKNKHYREKFLSKEKKLIEEGIFEIIFNSLKESIKKFEEKTGVKIDSERKLQDCLHLILKSIFARVDYEDPTEKIGLKSNRLDFVLKDHKIIIETKFVRDKKHAKDVEDELSKDYNKYTLSEYCGKLYNYIYDPNCFITDQANLISGLRKTIPNAICYIQ